MIKYIRIRIVTPSQGLVRGQEHIYSDELRMTYQRHIEIALGTSPSTTGRGLWLDTENGMQMVPNYLLQRSIINIDIWEE